MFAGALEDLYSLGPRFAAVSKNWGADPNLGPNILQSLLLVLQKGTLTVNPKP